MMSQPASKSFPPQTAVTPGSQGVSGDGGKRSSLPSWLAPILLVPVVLVVHGYHPFAGDAGIYAAGVRHILDPSLYPLNAVFVTAFTRRSIFAWVLAGTVRVTHLPLVWVLLTAHLFSIWLYLAACRELATRFFTGESARWGSVLLAAAWFTLPVAGTALTLMDPYVTARSFVTPAGVMAIAACLDRAWLRTAGLLLLAVLLHPLMGAYAAAFVTLQAVTMSGRVRLAAGLCVGAVAACGIAFALARGMAVSGAYREAVSLAPRSFLFLARWQWYEMLGLLLPLLLLAWAAQRGERTSRMSAVCLACVLMGSTCVVVAALFVPPHGPYLLVPLQVLRGFWVLYAVGVVLCGGLTGALMQRSGIAALGMIAVLCGGMFAGQRLAWSGERQIEWPGAYPINAYAQAFLWIRAHTPRDAIFAFDPRLDYQPGEDEQGFRAIAERDQVADDKDAGVAAVIPSLAERWAQQRALTVHLRRMSDAERVAVLTPLGARWLLLAPGAETAFTCPFRNRVVKVCRMDR